ncbi:MAG: hypothetical protein AAF533_05155 [Acidobacteriota bacterium]
MVRGTAGGGRWSFSVRGVADIIPRAEVRLTAAYQVHPRLRLGVEINPGKSEVGPMVNLRALSETASRPAIILGTSTDRIGTPHGMAYYATISKSLRGRPFSVAPYVGVSYGTFEEEYHAIGGLHLGFTERFSMLTLFDGVNVHPTFTWAIGRNALTLLLVEGEKVGFAWSGTW